MKMFDERFEGSVFSKRRVMIVVHVLVTDQIDVLVTLVCCQKIKEIIVHFFPTTY